MCGSILTMTLTTTRDFSRVVVVVVAVVVSVVSLLSLLLFALIDAIVDEFSSKFLPRACRWDDQPSVELLALPLTDFGVTLVVQTLASLLPVLLSLPVLQSRHRRSMHARCQMRILFSNYTDKYTDLLRSIHLRIPVWNRTYVVTKLSMFTDVIKNLSHSPLLMEKIIYYVTTEF